MFCPDGILIALSLLVLFKNRNLPLSKYSNDPETPIYLKKGIFIVILYHNSWEAKNYIL